MGYLRGFSWAIVFFTPLWVGATSRAANREQAVIAGHTIELWTSGDLCAARIREGSSYEELLLSLKPPCFFIREPWGAHKVKSYTYPDVGLTVLIVIGSGPVDSEYPIGRRKDCGTMWQGLLIGAKGVQASQHVARGQNCATWTDEKDYWLFAHP